MNYNGSEALKELYQIIADLESAEACEAFFNDICTIKELQDLSQRWEVAKLLNEGKNYQEISGTTGVSTATICRVNKCLMYGSGGYRSVLEKAKGTANKQ
jgi:TrpR-related protein YerC/YecD